MNPNVPGYNFNEKNVKYLEKFIKAADKNMNSQLNDMNKYDKLKQFLNLPKKVTHDTSSNNSNVSDIILISDDEIMPEEIKIERLNLNQSSVDVTRNINEQLLDSNKCLDDKLLADLHQATNLEEIFKSLAVEINMAKVINLGLNLKNVLIVNNAIVDCFVKYLLLGKINEELDEELGSVAQELCVKYPESFMKEISEYLLNNEVSKSFLQFIFDLDKKFQSDLLKTLVVSWKNIEENEVCIIESLINSQVDAETLTKLVQLMSAGSNALNCSKNFGKLLVKILNLPGKNLKNIEDSLRIVVENHGSVWKNKVLKMFEEAFEKNDFSTTQSFF